MPVFYCHFDEGGCMKELIWIEDHVTFVPEEDDYAG